MLQATVVGNVWSTKRIDGLPSGAFLEVEVTGSGERLVAFDVLGSGRGERVLVAQGSVAAGWLPDRPPVDALIIGSIDEPSAPPAHPPATAPPATASPATRPPAPGPAATSPRAATPGGTGRKRRTGHS
jgi:ethanolamine utilization protein EutN